MKFKALIQLMTQNKKIAHRHKPAHRIRGIHHNPKKSNHASLHRHNEFLAMVAHELNNIISPVINTIPVMRAQCAEDPELCSSLEILERQIDHMRRLLADLLDISRIRRGKIVLEKELIDASDVVHHAVESAHALIEERRHSLEVALPPTPLYLYADPMRLEQILVNLLINAAKYTDPGGHIWLTVNQEHGYAEFRVRDTGIGIAPEMLEKIFDAYRQVHPEQVGIGIGLTIIKNLTELHGGNVNVTSEGLGKGSEFVVKIPLGSL